MFTPHFALASFFMKYSLFIGRWQPFHEGHKVLVETALKQGKNVCIAIRNIPQSSTDPYTIKQREYMIRKALKEYGERVVIITIPDIEEICIGRKVGYGVTRVKLPKMIEDISGTKIREEIKK